MSPDATDSSQARPGSRAAGSLGWRLTAAARDIVARVGLLGEVQRLQNLRADRRRARRAKRIVPPIIARLSARADHAGSAAWRVNRVVPTVSDVLVVKAGPAEQPSEALIKIAETPAAAKGLQWQVQALKTLTGDQRLGEWRELLPQLLDAGEADTWPYLVETRVTGVNLEHALHDQASGDAALREAAEAIGHLHAATSDLQAVGDKHLDRWVREPTRLLASATNASGKHRPAHAALERLSAELCAVLEPHRIVLTWVHGDYTPGNILMGPDRQISGIVDWEFAHSSDFPSLDIVTLLLTVRMYTRRQELGRVVCDLIASPRWSEVESDLVASAPDAETWQAIGVSQIVLLCWLRHTAWMIERCSRYATSGLWLHTNVHMVLGALQDNA
jgi:thiamine kinase-like enzyme